MNTPAVSSKTQHSSISTQSTVIIRLQNLAWEARSIDIRQFFGGLVIPDGGVHIIGGPEGDAFIAFQSDEDARKAMLKNGHQLCGNQIRLMLSSKNEMYSIIAQAKMSNPYNAMAASATNASPPVHQQHISSAPQQQQPRSSGIQLEQQNSSTKLLQWFQHNPHHQQQHVSINPAVDSTRDAKADSNKASSHASSKSLITTTANSSGGNGNNNRLDTTRKLTVNEVQEKLSAMLNSARSNSGDINDDGQLNTAASRGKSGGNESNENERVALNFAQQLFSLLEMSTPSDGGDNGGSPSCSSNTDVLHSSTVERHQQDTSKIQDPVVNIQSPQRFPLIHDSQHQQQHTFTIPGLGNPSDVQNNSHLYQQQTFGSRTSLINLKPESAQQQPVSSMPPPLLVVSSLSSPVFPPNLPSTSHLPPFNHPRIIPPPGNHSFDINLLAGAPPRLIRPIQHQLSSTHDFHPQQFNPTTFLQDQQQSGIVPYMSTHQINSAQPNAPINEISNSSINVSVSEHMIGHQSVDNFGRKCSPAFNKVENEIYPPQATVGNQIIDDHLLICNPSSSTDNHVSTDTLSYREQTSTSYASEVDIVEPFLKLSNLNNTFTYKVIHNLFYPAIKIRLRDIKILNDPNGERTGFALISFISVEEAVSAWRLLMERSHGNVKVFPCNEYEYVCAVDSYMSSAMRKRASEGFYAIRIIGFPAKWDKRDIRKFFEGVNFHSRDKIQILETDYRNPTHNIAIALMASHLDLERAMFYDGDETGYGKISVNSISKEQVELETSSARYRQQQNRERGGSQNNMRGSGSSSHGTAFYEARSRRVDDDSRSYTATVSNADSRSNDISTLSSEQGKRFRTAEDDVSSSSLTNGSSNGTSIRLTGFPVLYTENDMRNLLVRAQLIPNSADASTAYIPMPEVICAREKDTNRLTGVVLVKFADAGTCRRALGRARHVLTAKSIDAEIYTPISVTSSSVKDAKRSRVDRSSDLDEFHRSGSHTGSNSTSEGRSKESRFSSTEKFTSPRPDYDDRRRTNIAAEAEQQPHRYRSDNSSRSAINKLNEVNKSRPRRDYEKRELPSRFDSHVASSPVTTENHQLSVQENHSYSFGSTPLFTEHSAYNQNASNQPLTSSSISERHVDDAGKTSVKSYPTQSMPVVPNQTVNKRPLLPDPVMVNNRDNHNVSTGHGNSIIPPSLPGVAAIATVSTSSSVVMSTPQPYISTSLQQPQCLAPPPQHLIPPPVPRAPGNLPPIPSELNHLAGQILLLDNVPFRATKEDICGWLSRFHPIESTLKIRHDDSGRPTGHAIVALQSRQDADVACSVLRGIPLLGRHIQTLIM
ncbi:hypothetical protein GJ496_007331 [Pomphorhynchus laevis]|nr:hypothetical protein GJ496_007331 [Pomphorhynchus laevis]